jgi:hypothetical protein
MGGVMLAQCPNTPYGRWGTSGGYIGIQTNNPNKPLHIFSSNVCTEAAIRLEYQGIPPYWGHLALICPNNLNNYSSIGLASDIILQADTNAGNVLITARNKGKAIKFSTTTSNSQPNTFFDYERFRISEDGYNTMVDIKVPELVPFHGSPILRFQRLQPNGQPLTFPGNNWHMGIDVNDTVTAFKFGAMDSTCALFDDTRSFTFTKEGNFGIGTGNPTSQFQISKGLSSFKIDLGSPTSDPNIAFRKPIDFGESTVCRWKIATGCDGMKFVYDNLLNIYDEPEETGENIKVTFTNDGNVGIGLLEPTAKLEIKVNDHSNQDYSLKIINDLTQEPEIFRVRNDGLVSIGSKIYSDVTPAELGQTLKLSVYGAIAAKEIVVEETSGRWADFVFEDDYNLMPLEELDKSIKENRKLPGIPSSEDVAKKGLKIAENQAKLLQKIEELTLYVIDLQKQCNELKQKFDTK